MIICYKLASRLEPDPPFGGLARETIIMTYSFCNSLTQTDELKTPDRDANPVGENEYIYRYSFKARSATCTCSYCISPLLTQV